MPVHRPAFDRKRHHRGFSLIETLLVLAVMVAATVGIYSYFSSVNVNELTHKESQQTATLVQNIFSAYTTANNFSTLSDASLVHDHLIPDTYGVSSSSQNPVISNAFGGEVSIAPATVDGDAGRGFTVTTTKIPQAQCAKMVGQVNSVVRARTVKVNGKLVGNRGNINHDDLASACAASTKATVVLTYQRQTGGSVKTLKQCHAPPTEHRTVDCPPGYAGEIHQEQTWSCPTFYSLPAGSGWYTTSNTCAIICHPDPTSPQTRQGPFASEGNNYPGCPSGKLGQVTYKRTSSCPAYTGLPQWSPWNKVGDNCKKACIVPAPKTQVLSCPAGTTGTNVSHKYAHCPATHSPYPGPVGDPIWGDWVNDGYNCTCKPPTPSTQKKWVTVSAACPAGTHGSATIQKEQKRTASCPHSDQGFVWSGWTYTGATRNLNTSACIPDCKPDSPLVQWVPKSGACSPGYHGKVTWEAQETRTSVCSSPEASAPVTSSWKLTGNIRNKVESCAPNSCAIPSGKKATWKVSGLTCSATLPHKTIASGQSVNVSQSAGSGNGYTYGSASYVCSMGVLSGPNSASCKKKVCTAPQPTKQTRQVKDCGSGKYGYHNQERVYKKTSYPTCWTLSGTSWENTSGSCHSCPKDYTKWGGWSAANKAKCQSSKYRRTGSTSQYGARVRYKYKYDYSCPSGTKNKPSAKRTTIGTDYDYSGCSLTCAERLKQSKWKKQTRNHNVYGNCHIVLHGTRGGFCEGSPYKIFKQEKTAYCSTPTKAVDPKWHAWSDVKLVGMGGSCVSVHDGGLFSVPYTEVYPIVPVPVPNKTESDDVPTHPNLPMWSTCGIDWPK